MKSRDQTLLEEAYQRILEGVYDSHFFKKQLISEEAITITDEDYVKLYNILDKWSEDVAKVSKEEMEVVRRFQPLFAFYGPLYRVVFLMLNKEYSEKELRKLDVKSHLVAYKNKIHDESSWGKNLKKIKDFAYERLMDDAFGEWDDFDDKNAKQIVTVFCKQNAKGFDVQKFYDAYKKKFRVENTPITSSAEIQEIIAPTNDTMEAKVVLRVYDAIGYSNKSDYEDTSDSIETPKDKEKDSNPAPRQRWNPGRDKYVRPTFTPETNQWEFPPGTAPEGMEPTHAVEREPGNPHFKIVQYLPTFDPQTGKWDMVRQNS